MSLISTKFIESAAESRNIPIKNPNALAFLASDVEYRLREIILEAHKFMRHAKRNRLTPADINHALRVRNVEPLYGYSAPGDLQFQYLESQDVFFIYDEEVALEDLINAPLPVVPLDVTLTAHWLAVEGVQPAIPQNPIPDRAVLSEVAYGAGQKPVKDEAAAEIKQLVKNVLTKELQIYYEKITDAIMSEDSQLQKAALASLNQDPGIQPLTPYFVQFASAKISNNLRSLHILETMLRLLESLLNNTHLHIEPHLHQMIPAVLTCIVGKRLGGQGEDHWQLRDYGAKLVAEICRKFSDTYPNLQPRATKTLVRAVLDPLKPLPTQYGAILGIAELGREPIAKLLISNLKQIVNIIREGGKQDGEAANKVMEKLLSVVAPVLAEEYKGKQHRELVDEMDQRFGDLSHDLVKAIDALNTK